MSDNATVDFYNKFVERLRIKLNEVMIASLQIETKLAIAEENVQALIEENEKLKKKVKNTDKKACE